MTSIPLIPELPESLRREASQGTLIPFIGAGVSRLAGCPGWDEFANAILKSFPEDKFSLSQLEQIKRLPPRIKLSLAMSMKDRLKIPINFEILLHPKTNPQEERGKEIYGYLSHFSKIFITTNYDHWLDRNYPLPGLKLNDRLTSGLQTSSLRTVIHDRRTLNVNQLYTPNTVIHLHGCLKKPQEMILTTKDYVTHYANDRIYNNSHQENRILTLLDSLFKERCVIFIGYGLEELEIIEYVIQKSNIGEENNNQPKHFILQGFCSHETEIAKTFEAYYSGLGINLLPFSKDEKSWEQLIEVIKKISEEIPIAPIPTAQKYLDMEALMND